MMSILFKEANIRNKSDCDKKICYESPNFQGVDEIIVVDKLKYLVN